MEVCNDCGLAVGNRGGLDAKFRERRSECVSEGLVGGACSGRGLPATGGKGANGALRVEACFGSEFLAGRTACINDILDQW